MECINNVPEPPIAGKVTHFSIELIFEAPLVEHQQKSTRLPNIKVIVQEEELGGLVTKGFGTVYSGYAHKNIFTGLEPRTTYRYRVKRKYNNEETPWSRCIEVSTTNKPPSAEDLHKAVLKNDLKAVEILLKVLNKDLVDVADKYGYSPLMSAVFKGFKDIAVLLLDHFADVNFQNSSGKNALMMACYVGHLDLVRLLRSAGASWTVCDNSGLSPLHWAVDGGDCNVIKWIVSDGCQVDWKDYTSGWTPLMRLSSMKGDPAVARILLNNGAAVNAVDKSRKSPLMMATLNGHFNLVKLFISEGAQVDTLSVHKKTALDFARTFNHKQIIELLERRVGEEKKRKCSIERSAVIRPVDFDSS